MQRCCWVNLRNQKYIDYHDNEWGKPVFEDKKLFEMLILESFQAGLSWEIVLNKREAFSQAFDDFDYIKISSYDDNKIEQLLKNNKIIRHRLKITAAVNNAKRFIAIQNEFGSFADYIWGFTDNKIIVNQNNEVKTHSVLSDRIAKDLQKRGFKFVGSTTIYSYLQAVGIINDHELNCAFR